MKLVQKVIHKTEPARRDDPGFIDELLGNQRKFYASGATRELRFRREQLKLLRKVIEENEEKVLAALWNDLRKPRFEAYGAEIAVLYAEIRHALKHIKSWARVRRVGTPLPFLPGRSEIRPGPYGTALIIGPWNYPFQLVIAPLVAAVAAGNTAVLKPSELAPNTSRAVAELIKSAFDPAFIAVVEGGVEATRGLLERKFDYIFFTGGTEVGKKIMEAAAKHLTPVTLELGGKSPVIVDRDADIDTAARRIAWGKFINAGQTCLAPDYVLAHREVKDRLVAALGKYINEFYGDNPKTSGSYARIINERHFDRIAGLMGRGNTAAGGGRDRDDLYIEPTVLTGVTRDDPVMKEEIFGPVLPVMQFDTIDEAVDLVNAMPRPLALYVFTRSRTTADRVLDSTSSGGAVVNDTVIHVGNPDLPFGGIGDSGMGTYHGKSGFETFSHMKSVLRKSRYLDAPFRYPPYRLGTRLLRFIFR